MSNTDEVQEAAMSPLRQLFRRAGFGVAEAKMSMPKETLEPNFRAIRIGEATRLACAVYAKKFAKENGQPPEQWQIDEVAGVASDKAAMRECDTTHESKAGTP